MEIKYPILFEKKEDCCGCGACRNICPRQAIKMLEDECGFLYPVVEEDLCIGCGLCTKVCNFQRSHLENEPIKVYAAISTNEEQRMKSSSGGIFSALASRCIENGGIVYGAELTEEHVVRHCGVEKIEDLPRLQGSKYVQSDVDFTYRAVLQQLKTGRQVIYSGTPCQIDGLYGFLKKDYENLLTVDIVCHGVPSNRMFKEYLNSLGRQVTDLTFRDKKYGWGIAGSAVIDGLFKKIRPETSNYLEFFLKGWIYRENCYRCKYTCAHRPGDITLGDYWGIEKQHPSYLGKNAWDETKGISVVLANTEKAVLYLQSMGSLLECRPSSFANAVQGNAQLRQPCGSGKRKMIMEAYQAGGWTAVDKIGKQDMWIRQFKAFLKSMLPPHVKRYIKARR